MLAAVTAAQAGHVYRPSELVAKSRALDGKRVHVRGWIVLEFENFNLWDSKADFVRGDPAKCVALDHVLDLGYTHFNRSRLALAGTFRSDLSAGRVMLTMCNLMGVDVDRSEFPWRSRKGLKP